jgi:hypothetical protein
MQTEVVSKTSVFYAENITWPICHKELLTHTARQYQTLHMTFALLYIRLSAVLGGFLLCRRQLHLTALESEGYAGALNGFLRDLAVIVSDHCRLLSTHEERY